MPNTILALTLFIFLSSEKWQLMDDISSDKIITL